MKTVANLDIPNSPDYLLDLITCGCEDGVVPIRVGYYVTWATCSKCYGLVHYDSVFESLIENETTLAEFDFAMGEN